jgi:hypothetical protein
MHSVSELLSLAYADLEVALAEDDEQSIWELEAHIDDLDNQLQAA